MTSALFRRSFLVAVTLAGMATAGPAQHAAAQAPATIAPVNSTAIQISWEVRNRFRLFKEERDFQLHVDAMRNRSVLGSEQALSIQSDGRGWARNTVGRLCIDLAGKVSEPCAREGTRESYLTPSDHPITVRLTGEVPVGAVCAWTFDDGEGPRQSTLDCAEPINFRALYGRRTVTTVDVSSGDGPMRTSTDIVVRDILIAGLGDSIASGEGNPDRPVALSDDGFCFRSYAGGPTAQYYRPSRAGFKGGRSCDSYESLQAWQRAGAQWLNAACHRSLYSYQTRAAIALAVQYPHIAVTYLPLACSGATIPDGLLGSQRARECLTTKNASTCAGSVNGQVAELRDAMAAVKKRAPNRKLDLVLLSIGANDINFSGLVADVIVDNDTERTLFRRAGLLGSVEDSRNALVRDLPAAFGKLREQLKPLVGGDMGRVVFAAYANPALVNGGACPGGPAGFDVHPSFSADARRLANVTSFVDREFLPRLRSVAMCEGGVLCRNPEADRMTFVDAHQQAFANHGFCARGSNDPDFDRACFSPKGESFNSSLVESAQQPMACGRGASEFRAYLPRARWIRDANDSYFAAMTYPQGYSAAVQPSDIHDATWGVLSAVYGGAIHPTGEGHAAMADAVVPAAANVLRLGAGGEAEVLQEPLAPVQQ